VGAGEVAIVRATGGKARAADRTVRIRADKTTRGRTSKTSSPMKSSWAMIYLARVWQRIVMKGTGTVRTPWWREPACREAPRCSDRFHRGTTRSGLSWIRICRNVRSADPLRGRAGARMDRAAAGGAGGARARMRCA
jgi:hypothetical protein